MYVESEKDWYRHRFNPWVGKIPWKRKPLQYSCLGNSMDRGAWPATAHRVTKSWTQLKQLSTAQHKDNLYLQSRNIRHRCTEQTCEYQRGKGAGGMKWEIGISIYTLSPVGARWWKLSFFPSFLLTKLFHLPRPQGWVMIDLTSHGNSFHFVNE